MLKLGMNPGGWLGAIPSQDPSDPRPFLLPGVRVRFLPIGIKAVRAARKACRLSIRFAPGDIEEAGDEISRELIRRGIAEWEGIGDADGNPVPPTQDEIERDEQGAPVLAEDGKPVVTRQGTVSLFLAETAAYEAADLVYVRPWSDREQEKNGFAGSPNGTSSQAMPALDTASSRARKRKKGAASRTLRRAKGAAPTSSTSPRQRKAKPSGT